MTDLYNGQITDLLQNGSRYNPEVIAISYAIRQEKQRIMELAKRTRTAAAIDELSETALDILAVELRTQYYGTDLSIEEKRTLIKNTLLWYQKAGTLAAVKELASVAYGDCTVKEWWEYGGEPGYFLVETSSFGMVYSNLDMFIAILEKVKRLSAHLEKVRIVSDTASTIGIGIANQLLISKTFVMEEILLDDLFIWLADESANILVDELGVIMIE